MARDEEVGALPRGAPPALPVVRSPATTPHSPPAADASFAERYRRVFTPALAHYSPLIVERAEGSYLYARDGRRYLDLGSGIGTINVGHSHPRVVTAAQAQLQQVTHLSITAYHDAPLALAEQLVTVTPPGLEMVFFGNSGTEAVEGALKLARRVTGRSAVVSFLGGFHGRTYGALSATASKSAQRAGYAPLVPGHYLAPYPPTGGTAEACLAFLDALFVHAVPTAEVAAILVEPVQGEGGVIVPPAAFLRGLRDRCDRFGIPLIFDEVQTGFGRTGAMFAAQRLGVTPDVMAVAKAMASGFPLGAVIGRRDLMEAWPEASHGTTFGGNLVACAAARATLEVLQEERLPERARTLGDWLLEQLRAMAVRHPSIAEVRGLGLMVGIACRAPAGGDGSAESAGVVAAQVERLCLSAGVLVLHSGPSGEVVRLLPPLTVEQADLARAVDILDQAFAAAERNPMQEPR
jgi:4-aminobutyrate aminotransferase